ncbi:MAG TPA: hypothetical protein VE957_07550 [Terriglobales bacterium]|nr:hypothetical protein [Terriglobales bacterium]
MAQPSHFRGFDDTTSALANFVVDGPTLIGFDPFVRLVDYLEQEAA